MAELSTVVTSERLISVKDPHGNDTGITVTMVSLDDEKTKMIKRRITDERIKLVARGKDFKADDIENNTHNLIWSALTGWNWGVDADGEPNTFRGKVPEFTKPNVIEVLTALPWFQQFLMEELSDTKAFFNK